MSFTLGADGTPIRKKDLSDWGTLEFPKITAMYRDPESGNIYVAKKEPVVPPLGYFYGPGAMWGYEYHPIDIKKTLADGTKVYAAQYYDKQDNSVAIFMYVLDPNSTAYTYVKRNTRLTSLNLEYSTFALFNAAYSADIFITNPPILFFLDNPQSPEPVPVPMLTGPWQDGGTNGVPIKYVKQFTNGIKLQATADNDYIKGVLYYPNGDIQIVNTQDMGVFFESRAISSSLTGWNRGELSKVQSGYIVPNPNIITSTKVSISLYNSQKQFQREIWSGPSEFVINGICIRKGRIFYTQGMNVFMIDPTGTPYRVAGTSTFSSQRLTPTAYARTSMLGNPYGIVYDASTDLIFFTDVEQAAVYSFDVDTGVLTNICAGSFDIVPQIDDVERLSSDCYIQEPAGIACAADGTLYVSSVWSGQIYKLRKAYDSTGALQYFISIFAGYNSQTTTQASEDDRPAKYARIRNPLHLAVDTNLNLYYYEHDYSVRWRYAMRIRYVQPDIYRTYFKGRTGAFNYWPLQVIMNNSPEGYTKEEPPVGSDSINSAAITFEFYANHLAADEDGNVYFCDPKYGTLNRVTPNNEVQVIAAGLPKVYSLAIINNTDAWICTLDLESTTSNSILYRIPFIQNPSWPITPDVTIQLNTRIESMAAHPRGYIFLASKRNIFTYDIANAALVHVNYTNNDIVSMCIGKDNKVLYLADTTDIYAYTIDFYNHDTRITTINTPAWPVPSTAASDPNSDRWGFGFNDSRTNDIPLYIEIRFYTENGIQNITFSSRNGASDWSADWNNNTAPAPPIPLSEFGITREGGQTIEVGYNGNTFTITSKATGVKKVFIPARGPHVWTNLDMMNIGSSTLYTSWIRTEKTRTLRLYDPIKIAGNGGNLWDNSALLDTNNPASARLPMPHGIAYNSAENCLYVTCGVNDQTTPKIVRRVDLSTNGRSGVFATTLIGSTRPGFPLSGASYSSVSLMYPTGIVATLQGSIYLIDTMYASATSYGNSTSVLIRVPNVFFLKPDLVYAFAGSGILGSAAPSDGTLTQRVALSTINGLTLDRDGNVYFTTSWNTIHKIDALTYKITKIAGTGAVPGTRIDGVSAISAPIDTPRGIVYSRSGILYFTEGSYIRYLERDGTGGYLIKTLAGNGTESYAAGKLASNVNLGITNASATLFIDYITDVLYVSIRNTFSIYRIDSSKRVFLVTNMSSLGMSTSDIHSICKYDKYLYVSAPHRNTIYRVDLTSTSTTSNFTAYIAPTGATFTDTGLISPYGVCVDKMGNLYVSMRDRHTIKRYSVIRSNPIMDNGDPYIGADGVRSYGEGEAISGIIDGMYRTNSRLHLPTLLTLDVYNRLFFVDQGKNRICCLATGVDLDPRGIPTKFIRVESAGPGRTFTLSRFDVYTLQEKTYDAIANANIQPQGLRSVDIELNRGNNNSIVITYINIKAATSDSLDSKVYLYNEFREILAVQTITAEALKPAGQNLIFIESWSQERINVPAIRNQLMNLTRGIQNVASITIQDEQDAIGKYIIVIATQNDQIQTITQVVNSSRLTTLGSESTTTAPTDTAVIGAAPIVYASSDTTSPYNMEVLCVFLMRKPGSRSRQLGNGIQTPVQVILKDANGITLKHKRLMCAKPDNIKYEAIDFRLNSELYSTLSMDAIYEAVFGVKRVRYVRIFFSETGNTGSTTSIKIRNICVVSAESGANIAYGKPVYDSRGNSYVLTNEEYTNTIGVGASITWLELDLQYPAIVDRVMINRADDDTTEYFIQGYTERRELVPFPTSAENPFSQKTSVVYVSGSGYNKVIFNPYLTTFTSISIGISNYLKDYTRKAAVDKAYSAGLINWDRLTSLKDCFTQCYNGVFSCSNCKNSEFDTEYPINNNTQWQYNLVVITRPTLSYQLQIQKLLAYPTATSTSDTMTSTNVTLRSSSQAQPNTNALTDDTNHFITPDRTNNAYWEATYNTPTYIKKFTLKQDPNDPAAKVRMFGINLRHYNQKRRLLGRYGARGNFDTEDFTYSQSPLNTYTIPLLQYKRGVKAVRYVRMLSRTSTGQGGNIQISQLAVFDTNGNMVSLNKPVTTAVTPFTAPNINNNKDWITQGHLYPSMYTMYHSYLSDSEWIQVDLGANFTGEIESVIYYNRMGELNNSLDQNIGADWTNRATGQPIQLLDTNGNILASRTLKGSLLRESLDFRPEAEDQSQYIRARYVRIENPGPITSGTYARTTMTFSSLKVNDIFGINVACGKSVVAMNYSAGDYGIGGESTDGVYGPIKTIPSNYTIGEIPGSYWEIDLGEEISIRSVEFMFPATEPAKFKNAPLNFYDEDRSLIAQYFMDPTSTQYEFNILRAVNPSFPSVTTRPVRFVQILGNTGFTHDRILLKQLIVLDRNGINVALGKPTYASPLSTDEGQQRRSYYAINGLCNNHYQVVGGDGGTPVNTGTLLNSGQQYFEVDLGGTYDVCAIILRGYDNVRGIRTFTDIRVNDDGRGNGSPDFSRGPIANGTEYKIQIDQNVVINPTPRTGIGKKARYVRLRQPPIPIATNRGENGIALSQIVVVDAIGRNVALGKNIISYPVGNAGCGCTHLNNGFYTADTWEWEKSIYNTTNAACIKNTTGFWEKPACANSWLSVANWNEYPWNTSIDTSWVEIDLGAEYWITEVIIHDIVNNSNSQANYDLILRDTYYNMVYYGQGVITAKSRSPDILHKRGISNATACPSGTREGSGTGGTETSKCYKNCDPANVLANDSEVNTTTTSVTQCYSACPSGTTEVQDTTRIFSQCLGCQSGSTYDVTLNKCLSDCPNTHEVKQDANGNPTMCTRFCYVDPSGNPMMWSDPVTKTECRTARFPGSVDLSYAIASKSTIDSLKTEAQIKTFMSNLPFGSAVVKSSDVYTDVVKKGKQTHKVIRYGSLQGLQAEGRARLLFKYYYDSTSVDNKRTFSGIINRTQLAQTTTPRPTIAKQVVSKTLSRTENDGYVNIITSDGTERRYEVYLDWSTTDTSRRFYSLSNNPFYIHGRSYSQSINFSGSRTSECVFPLPSIPFVQGTCPTGYSPVTNPSDPSRVCKQNKPDRTRELNGFYIDECEVGYSTISSTDSRCKNMCTGKYQVLNDNQCITAPPNDKYELITSNNADNWILCQGTDPNGIPYKYQNNDGQYVFNSKCYETRYNNKIPGDAKLLPLGQNAIGYDFNPYDRGLWEFFWQRHNQWQNQWTFFNQENPGPNYKDIPGCTNVCVTEKPPRATQGDIWPYFVHTYTTYEKVWGRWPSERWAWVSDTDMKANNNGGTFDRDIYNDKGNSWRNNSGFWTFRNIFLDSQGGGGLMDRFLREGRARWIYTKTPDDYLTAQRISRDIRTPNSNAILYTTKSA